MPNTGDIGEDVIGKASVKIDAPLNEYDKSLDNAEKHLGIFDERTQKITKKVGTAFLGAGATITAALTGVIYSAAEYGDQLDKMSLRTGVTVENLSKLGYAVKISGSDVMALETALRFLARRMDETRQGVGIAKDQFEKLGVAVQTTDGQMRPSVDVLLEVAEGISNLTSESEKVATAMDIFGARSGPQLLPLLKQGSDGILELTKRAEDLGLVVSTESALAAAQFNDALTDLKETTKKATYELGSTLLPVVERGVGVATDMVAWFNQLTATEKQVVGWGAAATGAFASTAGAGLLIVSQLPKMIAGFQALGVTTIAGGFVALGAGAVAAASGLWAVHRVMQALDDPTYHLRGQIEGLTQANAQNRRTVRILRQEMKKLIDKGLDPATVTMGDLDANLTMLGRDLGITIRPLTSVNDMIAVLEGKLEKGAKKARGLTDGIQKLREEEDFAKAATDAINEALANMNKTVADGATEWETLSKKFSEYTSITGEGYNLNTLQAIDYYETVKKKGLETAEAERGITNTISDLWIKWYSAAGFLAEASTGKQEQEYEKRAVLDEDHLEKIRRNLDRRLDSAEKSLKEESGLIEKGFEYEVLLAHKRSEKLIAERKRQFEREAAAREEHEMAMLHIEERALLMAEREQERILELQNRGYEETQRQMEERENLWNFYLRNATRQVQQEIDIQKGFTDKSQEQLAESYSKGMAAIEQVFEDFKPFFEQYNLDILELDRWRAEQQLLIEKALSNAKLKELDDYLENYEDHVRETERFWMVDEGFKIPLSSGVSGGSISENALYYGLAEAIRMASEEAKEADKALDKVAGTEKNAAGATADLSDELSGHSLTTALDAVTYSLKGLDEDLIKFIDDVTSFDETIAEASEKSKELEEAYTKDIYHIFADYMTGKVAFIETAYSKMLDAQRLYQKQSTLLESQYGLELGEAEFAYQRAQNLMAFIGGQTVTSYRPMFGKYAEEALPTGPIMDILKSGQISPSAPSIQINIENLYGGDESAMNQLAEDIARRIRGQNISI